MGDKEKCYPWPLCYYAWIQVIKTNYFCFKNIVFFLFLWISSRLRRAPWSTQTAEEEILLEEEETCLWPCSPSQTRQWWDCYWNKKVLHFRVISQKGKKGEKSPSSVRLFFSSPGKRCSRNHSGEKNPSPFDDGQVGKPLQVWEIGGCVPTWSKNRVSPRSPPLYLLIKWIGWRRKNAADRKFLHSKAVGAFFSFFFRLNLCAKSVSEFSLVLGFFISRYLSTKKPGKKRFVSGADSSSGLKYDLPCPPSLGDHLRAKMMEYSPAESGKAEHFYEAEFLDLFFFCPLKTSSCERGHWKSSGKPFRLKRGIKTDWILAGKERKRGGGGEMGPMGSQTLLPPLFQRKR